ncbi:MAG: hypothetical protein JF618_12280, partial [Leifsonia sp.]|nr:hypothetical protein [Leifsonia sp.]
SNAVVAHGNNASCPTAAVGFSATAGVQAAANINATGLTLELKAANEASNTSWKRFTQAATITITYNTPPNNPSAATYTSPSQSCSTSSTSPTYLDGTQAIGLGVTATDADAGQNVNTAFYVYNSTGAQVWTAGVATSAQGARSVTIPANALATGAYSWNARNGDLIDLSPGFSASCYFYITTVAPAPPGVTQTSTGTPVVGQPITVSFTSLAANQVKEFAYWWAPGPATNPATTTLTGGVLPACDSASGAVTFVCPDASGTKSGINVAPVDDVSTLWVVSFNAAGRVSVDSGGHYAATGLTVHANPDTDHVSFKSGHEWNMDSSDAPLYFDEQVADSNENAEDLYNNDWTANDLLWVDADSTTSDVYGPPPTTVLKFWGYTVLWFWTLPSSNTYVTLTENQSPPSGYQYASPHGLGYGLLPYTGGTPPENSQTLYSCALAGGQMTSLSATCEGNAGAATPLGYIYSSAAAVPSHFTARHLWRCTLAGKYKTAPDYNDSAVAGGACYDDSNAGWTYDVSLGWAASYDDTSTY